MGKNRRNDQRVLTQMSVDEVGNGVDIFTGVGNPGGWEVKYSMGDHGPQSCFGIRSGCLGTVEIGICHTGCPGEDHFSCAQFGTGPNHFRVDAGCFCGENVVIEPAGQFQVVGHSTKERHGGMIVAVD